MNYIMYLAYIYTKKGLTRKLIFQHKYIYSILIYACISINLFYVDTHFIRQDSTTPHEQMFGSMRASPVRNSNISMDEILCIATESLIGQN